MLRIYKASAGSGKTYTLAKDYIRLLIGTCGEGENQYYLNLAKDRARLRHDNRHRHILAVTFTRKATEEMKTRILKELKLLADPQGDSPYADDMRSIYKCSREDLALTAEMAMNQILFDYGNFQISTIDAFFQRVLHTFARELDRQTDYNIELDDKGAMRAAVGAMLDDFNSRATKDSQLELWLYEHIHSEIEAERKGNILNRRSSSHKVLVDELSRISMESFKPFSAAMREYLKTDKLTYFTKAIKHRTTSLLRDLAYNAGVALAGVQIDDCSSGIPKALRTILNGELLADPGKIIIKLLESSTQSAFKKTVKGDHTAESDLIRAILCKGYEVTNEVKMLKPIERSVVQLGFLSHVWDYLIQFSDENNTLLISDTNELVHRIIANDETPFIYERLGVQIGSFLIDEFQDTSEMQWNNLRPLIANGLGVGYDSLVIGDEKQSIYRFRNSDSSILHNKVGEAFDKYLDSSHDMGARSTNYRSSATVVKFNNALFSLLASEMKVLGFENVVQNVCDKFKNQHGYVRFELLPAKPKKGEAEDDEQENVNAEEYAFKQMAENILRQLRSGYKGQDIAILTNTNSEARRVVDYLLRNHPDDIKVVSDEALRISASTAVQMIVSMLRIMDQINANADAQPTDPNKGMSRSQVALTLSRFEYLLSREGEKIDPQRVSQLLNQAIANEDGDQLTDSIRAIRQQKPASLVALVEAIIGSQITEAERREQFAFISAFQDFVLDFVGRSDGSLHSFLDWWDNPELRKTIAGNIDADAVRVMTLHKSKGLEFKCVHIPLCKWHQDLVSYKMPSLWIKKPALEGIDPDIVPPALFIKVEKDFAKMHPSSPLRQIYEAEKNAAATDTLNKTYVGFTRAQRELLVWYKNDNSTIGQVIQEMFTRLSDQQLVDDDLAFHLSAYYRAETGLLSIGAPTRPDDQKEEVVAEAVALEDYPVHLTADRARDIIRVDDIFDVDRDIDDAKLPNLELEPALIAATQAETEARFEGVVLHDIMSGIYTAADLRRATSAAAARHHLKLELMSPYLRTVEKFLNTDDPRVQRWYGDYKNVYIEQPIFIPNKNFIKRPDRIVVNHDGSVDIIDYKFTEYSSHSGTAEQLKQVREYMSLMRDMGHTTVCGYLVYPRLSKIIEVRT